MPEINLFELASFSPEARAALLLRSESDLSGFMEPVQRIVDAVREEGDAAIVRLAREIDRVDLDPARLMATESEFAADPYQNPFVNDSMLLDRWAASATHRYDLTGSVALTTTAYVYQVHRDWWRQSSNSGQRPNDSSDPACAGIANLSTTCGNEVAG